MTATPPPDPQSASDVVELWSLRQDVLVELPGDGGTEAVLTGRWGEIRLPSPGATLCAALERMSYGPVSLGNVVPSFSVPGDGGGLRGARLAAALGRLRGVVVRHLGTGGGRLLLSVVPMARDVRFRPATPPDGVQHRLSRFASLHTDADGLCIESPLSELRVVLHTAESSWIAGCFARPTTVKEAARRLQMPTEAVRRVVGYLEGSGMLLRSEPGDGGEDHAFAEDSDPALVSWSPYDLMMHARSRLGRHDGPVGATYEHADELDPEPVVRAHDGRDRAGEPIPLPRPELDRLVAQDPPLTVALEARRSARAYGEQPLSRVQLAELLYRSARVRSVAAAGPEAGLDPPGTSRPYPSTGGSYALELYLVVSRCEGLPRGTYHYDPVAHVLRPVRSEPRLVDELLGEAREAAGLAEEPPVLVTMTARFRRITGKYSGFAYSGLLKDVGVLQQTLYLVCTAMGMASCALAVGDSDLSARALGLDWRTESSIGEFVLGSMPLGRRGNGPDGAAADGRAAIPVNGWDWPARCAQALRRMHARAAE